MAGSKRWKLEVRKPSATGIRDRSKWKGPSEAEDNSMMMRPLNEPLARSLPSSDGPCE
jgi:hypothetical protein